MYKLQSTVQVDLGVEIAALADYVSTRWDGVREPLALFTAIADDACAAMLGWYDPYALGEVLHQLRVAREIALKPCIDKLPERMRAPTQYDDHLSRTLAHLTLVGSHLSEAVRSDWHFEKATDQYHRRYLERFSGLDAARPKGWEAFRVGYTDYAGQDEYDDTADRAHFKGADTQGLGSFSFPVRIALPYVMYDDRCQGRRAPGVLTSAAFGHFMGVLIHNQSIELIEALRALMTQIDTPQLLFDLKLKSTHPVLSVLLDWAADDARSDSAILESNAHCDAHLREPLEPAASLPSDEELADLLIEELLESIKLQDTASEWDARRATKQKYYQRLLERARAQ